MSINKYFERKLPAELVRCIYEYSNPTTTTVDERIAEIVNTLLKEKSIDRSQLWFREVLRSRPKYSDLWAIIQAIKTYHLPAKTISKMNSSGGGWEKHRLENFITPCNFYVKRGDTVIAFLLCGYKYKIIDHTIYLSCKINQKAVNALSRKNMVSIIPPSPTPYIRPLYNTVIDASSFFGGRGVPVLKNK